MKCAVCESHATHAGTFTQPGLNRNSSRNTIVYACQKHRTSLLRKALERWELKH